MIELYTKSQETRAFPRQDDLFFKFPAGEWHMRAPQHIPFTNELAWVSGTDVNDYVKLALWADAVKQSGGKTTALIPYLPAARADRGVPFGAKVYSDLIKTAQLDHLACFDPHSPVMIQELAKDVPNVWAFNLDVFTIRQYFGNKYDGIIAPDKGAVDRAGFVAEVLKLPLIEAGKVRDFNTGNLTGFTCPPLDNGYYLFIDDLIDGGGTFNGLAETIFKESNKYPYIRLDLFASHGIFSKGIENLYEFFNIIYTTNSLELSRDVTEHPLSKRQLKIIDIKTTMIGH